MSDKIPAAPTSCQQHPSHPIKNESFNSFYFEVHSTSDFGRYLVAKEDIDEKTLILSEIPLVFGPTDDKDLDNDLVYLFCLACCKQLYPNEEIFEESSDKSSDDDFERNQSGSSRSSSSRGSFSLYYCSKCGWPVCDMTCEKSPVHSNFECKFFTSLYHDRSIYPPPHMWLMYKSVILLRLLLLIQRDPQNTWAEFLEKLEHHTEIRNRKANCVQADEIVLENMKYFTEALDEEKRHVSKKKNAKKYNLPYYNDKSILKRIIGTMNVNSFCANNTENKRIARCMFQTASLFAHSCAPNCCWNIQIPEVDENVIAKGKRRRRKNGVVVRRKETSSFKSPPEIHIYSAVPIKKGELVTIPYSTRHIFCGTLKRQVCMESVGHFTCKCVRCMDPSELGTFMSSILCFKCEKGFLVPIDPSDEESDWICSSSFNVPPKHDGGKNGGDADEKSSSSGCDYKCSVGKVVYFTTKAQDKIDRFLANDSEWDEEQEELQNLFKNYFGRELHPNHYLLFEISTRIVELLSEKLVASDGSCTDLETLRITNERRKVLVNRFLFHLKHLMKIANVILPGYNLYQEQIKIYLEEAELLKSVTTTNAQID